MDGDLLKAITSNLTVSVETAGKAMGVAKNAAYAAVKAGQIPSIRIGRKIAVPTAPLRKLLGIDCSAA